MNRVLCILRRILILFIASIISLSVFADGNLKLTYLDKEEYVLHSEERGKSYQAAYYGIYRYPLALTGGQLLYIFPDNSFSIVHFCDICIEEELEGYGTYKFVNSKITFHYELKPKNAPSFLQVRWGWIEKEDYVTGNLKILVTTQNLLKIKNKTPTFDYWVQIEQYHEWRKVRDNFINKVKKLKQKSGSK